MKKVVFVMSILALMSYGCNRGGKNTSSGTGMQKEESSKGTKSGSGSGSSSGTSSSSQSTKSGSSSNE